MLEYATCVFGSHLTAGQEQMLEDVQRQALLACLNAYRHTSHTKLLQEAGLQTLNIRRKYFGLCQYFKFVNFLVPDYLPEMLPRRAEEHQYKI